MQQVLVDHLFYIQCVHGNPPPPFRFSDHKFVLKVGRSVFCFANKFICIIFFDSTYKSDHMILVFLWIYFAQDDNLQVHPCCCRWRDHSFLWLSSIPLYIQCCCCSVTKSCPTVCDPMDCSTPGLSVTISQRLPKFMSIELVMLSDHLNLCCPLLLLPCHSQNQGLFQ